MQRLANGWVLGTSVTILPDVVIDSQPIGSSFLRLGKVWVDADDLEDLLVSRVSQPTSGFNDVLCLVSSSKYDHQRLIPVRLELNESSSNKHHVRLITKFVAN
jgi:hypothetical protein